MAKRPRGENSAFKNLLKQYIEGTSYQNTSQLAAAADVPLSNITMVIYRQRDLSPRAALKLAKKLVPEQSRWLEVARQLRTAGAKADKDKKQTGKGAGEEEILLAKL